MALEDDNAALARTVDRLRTANEVKDNENRRLRRLKDAAEKAAHQAEARLGQVLSAVDNTTHIPAWTAPKRKPRRGVGAPVLLLSDMHWGEVVDPYEMDGVNEYNHEIAVRRFERVINKTPEYLANYTAGVDHEFMVVALIGDLMTGIIHEELAETNDMTNAQVVVDWTPRIASALVYLAETIGVRLAVPCVDGNHDRAQKQKRHKQRATSSWAYVVYSWLADKLNDRDDIEVMVSGSGELWLPVYDTNMLFVHGDAVKGGGGIGGIWPPISRYTHKLRQRYANIRKPVDLVNMGHWHQAVTGPGWVVNGSLKGYDEFARDHGFEYQEPEQVLYVVTPERGVEMHATIRGEA